jgi:dolichol-phosphate mannosyltransferase
MNIMKNNDITIVIPVWNEENALDTVIRELVDLEQLSNMPKIIVDDGSTDNTKEAIKKWMSVNENIKYVYIQHGGKDKALWTGVKQADTEWIGIMDGDGQYDPYDFIKLYVYAERCNADAVWGIRIKRNDILLRKVISKIGKMVKRMMFTAVLLTDPGCGIMLIRKRYLGYIINLCPNPRGQIHCHLGELISKMGGNICETPVEHRTRMKGKAKFGTFNRIIPGMRSLLQAKAIMKHIKRIP